MAIFKNKKTDICFKVQSSILKETVFTIKKTDVDLLMQILPDITVEVKQACELDKVDYDKVMQQIEYLKAQGEIEEEEA